MEFSLKNLNFSSLVNNDESKKPGKIPQDASLDDTEEEKSVKLEQIPGYETPYLGMKVNPSCENLMKDLEEMLSDEDEDTYQGKKVIHNKNFNYNEQKVNTAKLVIDPAVKSRNQILLSQNRTAELPAKIQIESESSSSSEPSIDNTDLVKEAPKHMRESRQSNYFESIQQYKQRSSRGKSMFNSFLREKRDSKHRDSFNKLIWGGYHKIMTNNSQDNIDYNPEPDEEASFLEGETTSPAKRIVKYDVKKKHLEKYGKSSTKYRPLFHP